MATKIIYNQYIPVGKKFLAINLFGVVFAKRTLTEVELNHELIHSAQMRELWYVPFYLIYVIEWLMRVVQYRGSYKGYKHISFEQEAYQNQGRMDYLVRRKPFAFRKYV